MTRGMTNEYSRDDDRRGDGDDDNDDDDDDDCRTDGESVPR